jgi:hypothetical protein
MTRKRSSTSTASKRPFENLKALGSILLYLMLVIVFEALSYGIVTSKVTITSENFFKMHGYEIEEYFIIN